ncbi:MAG TPA: hypothetical protein DC049_17705 [Spirochaetia bacterium]|nr:hypothetical protein [Spirochaetia bacterium]
MSENRQSWTNLYFDISASIQTVAAYLIFKKCLFAENPVFSTLCAWTVNFVIIFPPIYKKVAKFVKKNYFFKKRGGLF